MTTTKLGNSATFNKLFSKNHVSAVNSVKYATNTVINRAAKTYHDTELQNWLLIRIDCNNNADMTFIEASNKCHKIFAEKQLDKESKNEEAKELYNCTYTAQETYAHNSSACEKEFESGSAVVDKVVDEFMTHLFDFEN